MTATSSYGYGSYTTNYTSYNTMQPSGTVLTSYSYKSSPQDEESIYNAAESLTTDSSTPVESKEKELTFTIVLNNL